MEAVILSARQEHFFNKPVSLIEFVPGVTLLDRTISVLRGVGVSRIVLVVGFKAECYRKIPGVTIVYNELFAETASMASLALAEPFVSNDFLLIESDLLFERTFLTRLIQAKEKNCLSITSENGSGDEAFVELEDSFVQKIAKDIHQLSRIDGEMVGLSKISIETFKQMIEKWRKCENRQVNYEYLLLDCSQLHERKAVKSMDLVCYEVDTEKDLVYMKEQIYPMLCRKENPFDRQNILDTFCQIMQLHDLSENKFLINQIGGMTNRNYKITYQNQSYVLRIPGNGTEGMVVRENESFNSHLAHTLFITPEIFYLNVETGVKLTRYIEESETLNGASIQRINNLEKVVAGLKILHTSNVRFNNDFNVFKEIISYEELLKQAKGWMYEGYESLRPRIFALSDRLNRLGVALAPCHNDLVAENFIKDGQGNIYLIDWEYSGMNDPLWDLSALFIESDFTEENREKALSLYYGGKIPVHTYTKILIYQILMDVLWAIWTRIKETRGDDFGNYGKMRFERAVECLKIVEEKGE